MSGILSSGIKTMRTYELQSSSGPDGWKIVERETPTGDALKEREALIRVHAVSLNYRDLALSRNPRQQTPIIPLSDGAGEVIAVGEGVSMVAVGDRVAGNFFPVWRDGPMRGEYHASALGGGSDGMLTEYKILPESALVKLPDNLSYEEAATLPCAAVTAWNCLFEQGNLQAGQTVLLLGTGGVSVFGLQFAKMAGAKVILTSSSDAKREKARQMGADETVNYKTTPDWDREVWNLTGKRGVDHVLEVGGAGTLEKSLASMTYGGHIALTGVLTGFEARTNPWLITGRSLHVNGVYVGSVAMFERMLAAMTQNQIRPVIDRVFPFEQAPDGLRYLQSGSHFGKIVITL
jgi:hypothetical protein